MVTAQNPIPEIGFASDGVNDDATGRRTEDSMDSSLKPLMITDYTIKIYPSTSRPARSVNHVQIVHVHLDPRALSKYLGAVQGQSYNGNHCNSLFHRLPVRAISTLDILCMPQS